MAKRGRKRKRKSSASASIMGIVIILIGIIGIGVFGPFGVWIKDAGVFFFGTHFNILMLELIALGIYMMLQGNLPNFLNTRLIGLYFLLVSFLTVTNMSLIDTTQGFNAQFESFINNFNLVISNDFINISQTGSGLFGTLFSYFFVKLLSSTGTYVILCVFVLVGIMFIFDITIADIVNKIKESAEESEEEREERLERRKQRAEEKAALKEAKLKAKEERRKAKEEEDEDEEEVDDGVIVTTAEDLKKFHTGGAEAEPTSPVESVPLISVNSNYKLPDLDEVLKKVSTKKTGESEAVLQQIGKALENVLRDFGIEAKVVNKNVGPTVTQFELAVKNGTKISKITGLSKEIALALAAKDVRIEAPIPGKTTVGVEIPNKNPVGVPIREVIEKRRKEMIDPSMKLPVSLGKDINGTPMIFDLAKTPHVLVAGSTGSGKSVCVNSFIASLLINKRPDEVKLILVDPKKVELSNYNGIPHLECPVITDPKKASIALQNVVREMERRYGEFENEKVKNITGYNEKIEALKKKNPEDTSLRKMPYWLVIIDELADLMLVASKEVEDSIMRITQMARAAGIHLLVATQRPSTDVITGVVKANIPSRISFAVASQIDSRTILDMGGAEKLLGKGDMLFKPMGQNNPTRIQGNFISDEEIENVIAYVSKQQSSQYNESMTVAQGSVSGGGASGGTGGGGEDDDPLYNEIVDYCIQTGKVSASLLQRKFRLGYNRAARIVDILEERGIIGPQNGSKPREVLVKMKHDDEEE